MKISVIIPTCREAGNIEKIIREVKNRSRNKNLEEIIVVDACSGDNTAERAERAGARVILSERKSRAVQMNIGAALARGDIFYFLHADTLPPRGFDEKIMQALRRGTDAGCFRMKFDSGKPFFRFFGYLTRFNSNFCRFGDQSLFITRSLFGALGGYDEGMEILEDNDIVRRISRKGRFSLLPDHVLTSARRYRKNGIYRLQWDFAVINLLYYLGCSQEKMLAYYRKHIR